MRASEIGDAPLSLCLHWQTDVESALVDGLHPPSESNAGGHRVRSTQLLAGQESSYLTHESMGPHVTSLHPILGGP